MPNYNNRLNLPNDTSLPFFDYGIFKPGQLAYPKIKNLVNKQDIKSAEITYRMKIRDGIPILTNAQNNYYKTKGVIMTFKNGQKAYEIISNTFFEDFYEWKTLKIDGDDVNVLFGKRIRRGSDTILNEIEKEDYDGKNDPFFNETIDIIENYLNRNKDQKIMIDSKKHLKIKIKHNRNLKNNKSYDYINDFFELQKNYMLLWSSIERYTDIKYNETTKKKNNYRFSEEKAFRDGMNKNQNKYHKTVFSTKDLEKYGFYPTDSYRTIDYYYTFRCNVVHRGKASYFDYTMLETATMELLEIFKNALEDTWNERNLFNSD